jgi:hypothetical protein
VNAITENVQCVQALSFKCCSLGYNSIEPWIFGFNKIITIYIPLNIVIINDHTCFP